MIADRLLGQLVNGLLDASVKSAVVLLAVAVAAPFLRRKSAAMRHLMWTLAVSICILMPAVSAFVPAWRLNVLPPPRQTPVTSSIPIVPLTPVPMDASAKAREGVAVGNERTGVGKSGSFPPGHAGNAAESPTQITSQIITNELPKPLEPVLPPRASRPIALWIAVVWTCGAAIIGLSRIIGSIAIAASMRRATAVAIGPIKDLSRSLSEELGIHREVELVLSDDCPMPSAWGIFQPRIMLPASVNRWPLQRTRSVLLHELSHVRRWDCGTQLLAHLARTIYWFNPLAWWAHNRMLAEQERACDDAVLAGGAAAASYAEDLVAIARTLRPGRFISMPAVSMARGSHLRQRVGAILENATNRRSPGRGLIVACALTAAAVLLPLSALHLGPRSREARAADSRAAAQAAPATKPAQAVDLLVIDETTKQPLKDVTVGIHGNAADLKTGADGHVSLPVPAKEHPEMAVEVEAARHVPVILLWLSRPLKNDFPPSSYTLALEPGKKVSGKVTDDAGKPVQGAHVKLFFTKKVPDGPQRVGGRAELLTAADGSWSYDSAPANPENFNVGVWDFRYANGSHYPSIAVEPVSRLFDGSYTFALKSGLPIEGVVMGIDGKPLEGAEILYGGGEGENSMPAQKTDKNGHFAYFAERGEAVTLVIRARGCAPEMVQFTKEEGKREFKFDLVPARRLFGRVVGPDGEPIPKAWIYVDRWRGSRSIQTRFQTDKEGRFDWKEAPADEVKCEVEATGYIRQQQLSLIASDKEITISMPRELHVHGAVVDADTNQPIDVITVVHGQVMAAGQPIYWSRPSSKPKPTGGKFDYRETWQQPAYAVRIEAEGYLPAESRMFKADERDVALEFKLKKAKEMVFSVLRQDGKPSTNETALLLAPGTTVVLNNGRTLQVPMGVPAEVDGKGRLSLQPQPNKFTLVLYGQDGYGEIQSDDLPKSGTITLQAWFAAEGKVMIGNRPGGNERVSVQFTDERRIGEPHDSTKALVYHQIETTCDGDGKFSIDRIPPGKIAISRTIFHPQGNGYRPYYIDAQFMDAAPGQTAHVTIGGGGRTVVGRVEIPESIAATQDWTWTDWNAIVLKQDRSQLPTPPDDKSATPAQRRKQFEEWEKTEAGQAYKAALYKLWDSSRQYPLDPKGDGTFQLEGVAPGTYTLSVGIKRAKSTGKAQADWLAKGSVEFTVPPGVAGPDEKPVTAPVVKMTPYQPSAPK
jgi:beta-lactamase regulating signal transducer with metallopeptidase domain